MLAQAADETGTQVISPQALTAPAAPKTMRVIRMPRAYTAP
jgi:hypothetical protein